MIIVYEMIDTGFVEILYINSEFGRETAAGIFLFDQVSVESMLFYLRYCLHLTHYIHLLVAPKCIVLANSEDLACCISISS